MIILEGVDRAGKTTLANRLQDKFGLMVDHCGIPKGDPVNDYIDILNGASGPVIWDRFIFGEIPYSIVKKRPRYIQYFELQMLELMLATMPRLLVYVRPPREVIQRRLEDEPDSYVSVGEAMQLYDEYEELTMNVFTPVFEYHGDEDWDLLLETIDRHGCMDERLWNHYNVWKAQGFPGIGTLTPKYLFVGERQNSCAEHQVTFWSKMGVYLLEHLEKAGVKLQECHFTNAFDLEKGMITRDQVRSLGAKKIISLGLISMARMKEINVASTYVHHPGFWQRFRTYQPEEYTAKLRAVCTL